MMNKKRQAILREIVGKCRKNLLIKRELIFISLLGSSQTGEAVDNYSDLDVLLVLKSSKSGFIKKRVLLELKKLTEQISQNTDIEISILTHTEFDFNEYVDLEYLIHYSWGRVLFGSKESYKNMFSSIIKEKYSKEKLRDLAYYDLIHARFNVIRKYVSWNKFSKNNYTKDLLKLIVDKIIEICDWALIYKGIFMKTKKEIVQGFNKNFNLKKYNHIPEKAYYIRANWESHDFSEGEICKFMDDSIMFIQELIRTIHKNHGKH